MKTKIKFSILVFICASSLVFAQSLTDAIKRTTNEQFEKASAIFKDLVASQPSNGEVLFYQGENYFKNEQLDKAQEAYQKGIEVNSTNPICYVGVGKIQWVQGKQTEAKANFFKATTLAKTYKFPSESQTSVSLTIGKGASTTKAKYVNNSEATVLYKIAEVYINSESKDLAQAQSLLAQAIKLEVYNPEIYLTRGDAYLEQNDGTKAIENYEQVSAMDQRSVRAILRQGQVWNRARNYEAALKKYKEASLIDSTFAPAYREKAEIYFRAGRYSEAANQYKRYLELNNDCSALGRYAGFLNQAKLYKESIEASKKAMECDPNNAYLYRYKGRSEFDSGDFTNGLQTMNTFFEMSAKNPGLKIIPDDYEYRAKLYSKNGKDSLAVLDYKKAMELQPDKMEIYGDLANAYIKMKKYPEAIEAYKTKMAKIKPNANDYFGIGRAYYYSKDFVNADSAFNQIVKMQPELALGYFWRGRANSQIDSKNEKWLAQPYYETYISKVKPEDVEKNKKDLVEAYTYIGVYLMNSRKDFCAAKVQFKKVMELDPANENGKNFMKSKEATACP